ncbi:hypothetical protein PR048_023358 [Dryococelus australis]|uniref:Uncharacterized protein n=1 Tax=Dryococelus australis TaxID=614101 RepID=A0ABQ9GTY4_9NEOP|nr:hypothetical protein PR048_023358 [Dryococelus australis]
MVILSEIHIVSLDHSVIMTTPTNSLHIYTTSDNRTGRTILARVSPSEMGSYLHLLASARAEPCAQICMLLLASARNSRMPPMRTKCCTGLNAPLETRSRARTDTYAHARIPKTLLRMVMQIHQRRRDLLILLAGPVSSPYDCDDLESIATENPLYRSEYSVVSPGSLAKSLEDKLTSIRCTFWFPFVSQLVKHVPDEFQPITSLQEIVPNPVLPALRLNRRNSLGAAVVTLLTSRLGEPGSILGGVAPGFSHEGIEPDYAGFLRGLHCSLAQLHSHLVSTSSALKTSICKVGDQNGREKVHECSTACDVALCGNASGRGTEVEVGRWVGRQDQPAGWTSATLTWQGGRLCALASQRQGKVRRVKYQLLGGPPTRPSGTRLHGAPRAHIAAAATAPLALKGESGSIPGRFTPDLCKWESCRTMPLVGGFSRDLPFPPPFHFGTAPYASQSPTLALMTPIPSAYQHPISNLPGAKRNQWRTTWNMPEPCTLHVQSNTGNQQLGTPVPKTPKSFDSSVCLSVLYLQPLLGLSRFVDFFSNVSAVVAAAIIREQYLVTTPLKPRSLEIDDNGRESLRTCYNEPWRCDKCKAVVRRVVARAGLRGGSAVGRPEWARPARSPLLQLQAVSCTATSVAPCSEHTAPLRTPSWASPCWPAPAPSSASQVRRPRPALLRSHPTLVGSQHPLTAALISSLNSTTLYTLSQARRSLFDSSKESVVLQYKHRLAALLPQRDSKLKYTCMWGCASLGLISRTQAPESGDIFKADIYVRSVADDAVVWEFSQAFSPCLSRLHSAAGAPYFACRWLGQCLLCWVVSAAMSVPARRPPGRKCVVSAEVQAPYECRILHYWSCCSGDVYSNCDQADIRQYRSCGRQTVDRSCSPHLRVTSRGNYCRLRQRVCFGPVTLPLRPRLRRHRRRQSVAMEKMTRVVATTNRLFVFCASTQLSKSPVVHTLPCIPSRWGRGGVETRLAHGSPRREDEQVITHTTPEKCGRDAGERSTTGSLLASLHLECVGEYTQRHLIAHWDPPRRSRVKDAGATVACRDAADAACVSRRHVVAPMIVRDDVARSTMEISHKPMRSIAGKLQKADIEVGKEQYGCREVTCAVWKV